MLARIEVKETLSAEGGAANHPGNRRPPPGDSSSLESRSRRTKTCPGSRIGDDAPKRSHKPSIEAMRGELEELLGVTDAVNDTPEGQIMRAAYDWVRRQP